MASGPASGAPRPAGDLRQALHARERARELVALHRDAERPERPVFSIVAWGLVAFVAFGGAVYVAYATWYQERLSSGTGLVLLLAVLAVHAMAVFGFSYAYEVYDARKALKLALVVLGAVVSVIAVLIGIFVVLAALRDGDAGDIADALGGVAKGISKLGMDSDDVAATAGNVVGSFLDGQGPAVAAGIAMVSTCPHCGQATTSPVCPSCHTNICPHTSLFARWDSAEDMGKPDKVTSYLCTGCESTFTREEGERLQADRTGTAV